MVIIMKNRVPLITALDATSAVNGVWLRFGGGPCFVFDLRKFRVSFRNTIFSSPFYYYDPLIISFLFDGHSFFFFDLNTMKVIPPLKSSHQITLGTQRCSGSSSGSVLRDSMQPFSALRCNPAYPHASCNCMARGCSHIL